MKKQLLKTLYAIIAIAILFTTNVGAQIGFEKSFDFGSYDIAHDAMQVSDSGFLVTGGAWILTPYTGFEVFLIKYNQFGDTVWTKQYPSMGFGLGNSLIEIPSGGFIVAGGYYNSTLLRTNLLGDTIWTRVYQDQVFYDLKNTLDNNLIVCGQLPIGSGPQNDSANILLTKVGLNGNVLWTKNYGGNFNASAQSIIQVADSGFILCGYLKHTVEDSTQAFIMKTDKNGDSLWINTYGGLGNDFFYSIKQTFDGGYILCGSTHNNSLTDSSDVWLYRTDFTGNVVWSRIYGGWDNDEGRSVYQTSDSGFVIAGSMGTYPNENVYLIRTNSFGDSTWTRQYGGINGDYGFSVRQTFDSGFLISGGTWSFGVPPGNGYLIKTDGNGITSVEELKNNTEIFSIYPNPANTSFSVHSKSLSQNATIEIINVLGEINYSAPFDHETLTLNCKEFSSGIYFVKVLNGDKYYCKKIIVEHN